MNETTRPNIYEDFSPRAQGVNYDVLVAVILSIISIIFLLFAACILYRCFYADVADTPRTTTPRSTDSINESTHFLPDAHFHSASAPHSDGNALRPLSSHRPSREEVELRHASNGPATHTDETEMNDSTPKINVWRRTFQRVLSDGAEDARNRATHAMLCVPFDLRLQDARVNAELEADTHRQQRAKRRRMALRDLIGTETPTNVEAEGREGVVMWTPTPHRKASLSEI